MKKLLLRLTALVLCLTLLTGQALAAETVYSSDHILLKYRGSGTCQAMTGNITLACVFVNLPDATWDDAAMQARKDALASAVSRLTSEAAAYGVELSFSAQYFTADASRSVTLQDKTSEWAEAVVANTPGMEPITYDNEAASYYQGMPILFFVPVGGRSFAQSKSSNTFGEFLVLYVNAEPVTIRHELLHLFGARDYYTMNELKESAQIHLPGSIMLSTSEDENSVDSLTAYTIGWCSTLDAAASDMLQATEHITQEDINNAKEENRFTGYIVQERSDCTYAGMLTDGSRNGYGKITWTNGDSYEGNWVWGERTGKGTYTWASGATYTGDFIDGVRTGKGTYTWADGATYTGDFINGVRTGKGTYTWADGATYTGDFVDGKQTGKGTFSWASGATYTGDFIDGVRTGKGIYTWPNGNIYIGDFVDGKRTGFGMYISADGETTVGQWQDGQYIGE